MGPGGDAGERAAAVRPHPARQAPPGFPGTTALGPETSHPCLAACPGPGTGGALTDTVSPQLCLPPRAAKQRRKGDRLVIACQEQTYWLVNRPPVSLLLEGGSWTAEKSLQGQCVSLRCSLRTCLLTLGKDVSFEILAKFLVLWFIRTQRSAVQA